MKHAFLCLVTDSLQIQVKFEVEVFIAILLYVETHKGMKCDAITDLNLMKGLALQICDAGLWNDFYSEIVGKFHKYYKVTI